MIESKFQRLYSCLREWWTHKYQHGYGLIVNGNKHSNMVATKPGMPHISVYKMNFLTVIRRIRNGYNGEWGTRRWNYRHIRLVHIVYYKHFRFCSHHLYSISWLTFRTFPAKCLCQAFEKSNRVGWSIRSQTMSTNIGTKRSGNMERQGLMNLFQRFYLT